MGINANMHASACAYVCIVVLFFKKKKKSGHLRWQNVPIVYVPIETHDTLCWPNLY